jgi:hypothetical protein
MADTIPNLDFDPKPVGATDNFSINAYDLVRAKFPTGTTVASAVVVCTVISGTDASPSSLLSGAASVNGTAVTLPNGKTIPIGYLVTQKITAGVVGVKYLLTYTLTMSQGGIIDIVRGEFTVVA